MISFAFDLHIWNGFYLHFVHCIIKVSICKSNGNNGEFARCQLYSLKCQIKRNENEKKNNQHQ